MDTMDAQEWERFALRIAKQFRYERGAAAERGPDVGYLLYKVEVGRCVDGALNDCDFLIASGDAYRVRRFAKYRRHLRLAARRTHRRILKLLMLHYVLVG